MERASRQGTIYAIVLVVVVTALTLRRWRETLLALLPLVLGLVWTLGLMYFFDRSEEHTSELQSRLHLVCRLLLEKKKNIMVTLHEVITFLVSMQISISSLQTHTVNRCGRSRHLARKLSLRRQRSSPNVFEMVATESITSISLIKLIRVSLG